jgi:Fic family protein
MDQVTHLSRLDVAQARARRLAAMRLQEIEGNPLSAEQVAMFEMFEREGWSFEQRREYMLRRAQGRASAK